MTKRIMAVAIALVAVSLLGVRAVQAEQVTLLRVVPFPDFPLDSNWTCCNRTIILIGTDGVAPLSFPNGCTTAGGLTFQGIETIVLFPDVAGVGALHVTMYGFPSALELLSRGDRIKDFTSDSIACCVDASFNNIGCSVQGATEVVRLFSGTLQQPASAGATLFTTPVALDVDALGVVTCQPNNDGTHTVIFKTQGSPAQQVDIASFDELLPADVLRDLIDLGQDPETGEHLYFAFVEW